MEAEAAWRGDQVSNAATISRAPSAPRRSAQAVMLPSPMENGGGRNGRLRVVTLVGGIGLTGGAERLAREIVARLDPDRFEPHALRLALVRRAGARSGSGERGGGRARRMPASGSSASHRRSTLDLAAWRPLYELLRERHRRPPRSQASAPTSGRRSLGTTGSHSGDRRPRAHLVVQGQPVRKLLDRRLIAARADAFLAVSEQDRRRMIEIERIDPGKVIFVPNGIPARRPPATAGSGASSASPPTRPVVGTVCALRPQKALDGADRGRGGAARRRHPGAAGA